MECVEKLAVFDLDDTLYVDNSHFVILNTYYCTHFFTSIPIRALGKFLPALRLRIINIFYKRIPCDYRQHFLLPYRQDILTLLKKKEKAGYKAVIVSNAPIDLLRAAALDLHIEYISAEVGRKAISVQKNFSYKHLFVCTDNKTDIDLLSIADEAIITCRKKDEAFFCNALHNSNYSFYFRDI